jgi:hypothetical protein
MDEQRRWLWEFYDEMVREQTERERVGGETGRV